MDLTELFDERPRRSLRRLPPLIRQAVGLVRRAAPHELTVTGVVQLLAGAAVAVQLLLGKRVLADLLGGGGGQFRQAVPDVVALALVTAALGFAAVVQGEYQRMLAELTARYAGNRVLDVSTSVDLLAYEVPDFHNRLTRAQLNAEIRPVQMATGVIGIIGSLFAIAGVSAALITMAPEFLVLVVAAVIPAWYAATVASRASFDFAVAQTERDRRRLYLRLLLAGKEEAKELRSYNLATFLRRQYDSLYAQRIEDLRKVTRRRVRLGFVGGAATSALTAGTIALLVWLVTSGSVPVADAGAAAAGVVLLAQRLQALASNTGQLYESSLFLDDYTSFLDVLPRVRAATPDADPPNGFERISTDGVWFTYPSATEPSLRDVTMHIDRGEVIALVGENGSGKTTLAKLLAGLYTPATGCVRWDATDVATVDPDRLREQIALIFQDFVKYQMTVRENIGMGRHANWDDVAGIVDAARQVGADGFITELPDGYETSLGPQFFGGRDLSVGQWQRIALARAFFRGATLVILDEPTASLDPKAEADLLASIRTMAAGRTVLFISHRFSSVREADRIYVLDHGRIIEEGTHADLLAREGRYAEMFSVQAAPYHL